MKVSHRSRIATPHLETIMGDNTRLHDGIAGALMLQSAFTGFCPVYYTLARLRPTRTSTAP